MIEPVEFNTLPYLAITTLISDCCFAKLTYSCSAIAFDIPYTFTGLQALSVDMKTNVLIL